jgi:hypothetical protein
MRDVLVNLDTSQVGAESRVTLGGYEDNPVGTPYIYNDKLERQFSVNDQRHLDEMVKSLLLQGFMPLVTVKTERANILWIWQNPVK